MGRKSSIINLTAEDREYLEMQTRARTIQAQTVSRARILLLKADGCSIDDIADKVGINRKSVMLCLNKYAEGGVENAHTLLRMVLPKGTSFEFLTQWDVNLIVNHINSTPRKSLNGSTPYDVSAEVYGEEVLKKLQLRRIDPDEVKLSPKLIRNN